MTSTKWKRPWCWIVFHRWGPVVRTMYRSGPLSSRALDQRYCERCGKAKWG